MYDTSRCAAVIALCLLTIGCTSSAVPPNGKSITGDSGGCGNFVVYRFNQARTLAVVITAKEHELSPSKELTQFKIGSEETAIDVEVLRFKEPAHQYFCDDVDGDPQPIAKWTATQGSIKLVRTTGKPPENLSIATHKISVFIQNAKIKHSTTGDVTEFGDVKIEDVWVGWFAG